MGVVMPSLHIEYDKVENFFKTIYSLMDVSINSNM